MSSRPGHSSRGRRHNASGNSSNNNNNNRNKKDIRRITALRTIRDGTSSNNPPAVVATISSAVSRKRKAEDSQPTSRTCQFTPNAVRKMLLAETYESPLLVALHCQCSPNDNENEDTKKFMVGKICDNSFQAPVLVTQSVWQSCRQQTTRSFGNKNSGWLLVEVRGYVTSTVNGSGNPQHAFRPFLCLTNVVILVEKPPAVLKKTWPELQKCKRSLQPSHDKLSGGTTAPFLHTFGQLLTAHDWMGLNRVELSFPAEAIPPHEKEFDEHHETCLSFLRRHQAMETLRDHPVSRSRSNSAVANTTGDDNPSNDNDNASTNNQANAMPVGSNEQQQEKHQHDLYFSALNEFLASQVERQKVSLSSNSGRANAKDAEKVVLQHKETLEEVLCVATQRQQQKQNGGQEEISFLTLPNLKKWHAQLCGNGLHEHAGNLRSKVVKTGRTHYGSPEQVAMQLQQQLLPAFEELERRLGQTSPDLHAFAAATFSAATYFLLCDCHPFADGNGRLSRMLSNAALRLMGIPFCVNWFATPAQRRDYVSATLMTRRNLTLVYRGDLPESQAKNVIQSVAPAAGGFFPLAALLMDRLRRAILELEQLQHDKHLSAVDHSEAVAARRARERAAAGTCLICFDDNPNIATLCCGKAVHLSCMAEWLSTKSSCPQCRGDFPSLPQRPALRAPGDWHGGSDNSSHSSTRVNGAGGGRQMDFGYDSDGVSIHNMQEPMSPQALLEFRARLREESRRIFGDSSDDDEEGEEEETTELLVAALQRQAEAEDEETTEEVAFLAAHQREVERNNHLFHAEDFPRNVVRDNDYQVEEDTEEADGNELQGAEEEETTVVVHMGDHEDTEFLEEYEDTTVAMEEQDNEDTTESTGSDGAEAPPDALHHQRELPPIVYCHFCRNRAAQECTNDCCGRCCLLHGQWSCHRHSG